MFKWLESENDCLWLLFQNNFVAALILFTAIKGFGCEAWKEEDCKKHNKENKACILNLKQYV